MRTQRQTTTFMVRWLLFFCGISLVYVGLRSRLPVTDKRELPFHVSPAPYVEPEMIHSDKTIGPGARLVVHHEGDQGGTHLMVDIGDDRKPLDRLQGKTLQGLTLYADHWLVLEFEEDSKDS